MSGQRGWKPPKMLQRPGLAKPGRYYTPRLEEARKRRGYCYAKGDRGLRVRVSACACIHLCMHAREHTGALLSTMTPSPLPPSPAMFTIGQVQWEAQKKGSPLMWYIHTTHLRHHEVPDGLLRMEKGERPREVNGRPWAHRTCLGESTRSSRPSHRCQI